MLQSLGSSAVNYQNFLGNAIDTPLNKAPGAFQKENCIMSLLYEALHRLLSVVATVACSMWNYSCMFNVEQNQVLPRIYPTTTLSQITGIPLIIVFY